MLPRQEDCLSHTPSTCHTYIALVFSHSRTLSHDVLHSPFVSSKRSYFAHRTQSRYTENIFPFVPFQPCLLSFFCLPSAFTFILKQLVTDSTTQKEAEQDSTTNSGGEESSTLTRVVRERRKKGEEDSTTERRRGPSSTTQKKDGEKSEKHRHPKE